MILGCITNTGKQPQLMELKSRMDNNSLISSQWTSSPHPVRKKEIATMGGMYLDDMHHCKPQPTEYLAMTDPPPPPPPPPPPITTGTLLSSLLLFNIFHHLQKIIVTLTALGKATATARAALPISTSVCSIFKCPNNGFNVCTHVDACD